MDFRPNFWKLTLPIGRPGKPKEVYAVNGEFENFEGVFQKVDNAFVMTCQVGGVTTPGSSYSRCEFRELGEAHKLASWKSKEAVNTMKYSFSVDHFPPHKPHVVVGQIHDDKDDVIMVRYEHPNFIVTHDSKTFGTLFKDYVLGCKLDVEITFSGTVVTVKCLNNGVVVHCNVGKKKGCYFKVGNYIQSNKKYDDPAEYSQVTLFSAVVTHSSIKGGPKNLSALPDDNCIIQ